MAKRPARPKKRSEPRRSQPQPRPPAVVPAMAETSPEIFTLRELFWHNVVREMLTGLAMLTHAVSQDSSHPQAHVLDGRLALITSVGERIPVAGVTPLFACGVPGSKEARALSVAVECTVFQVRAPTGEQFTIPLHEVRGIHALTEELMKEAEEAARASSAAGEAPFGFAAFTSLARTRGIQGQNHFEPGDAI